MGFGFNLFFVFILLPGSVLLAILGVASGKKLFWQLLGGSWAGVIGLGLLSALTRPLFETIQLEKQDYYGSYVIDRSKCPGRQADWQYQTFRFDITTDDRIAFYVLENGNVAQTYRGTISTVKPYSSERLVLHMAQPAHHILTTDPTIYRRGRRFYLVFNSPRFGNVFFT